MNERRDFLKLVAAGPAGALLLPLFAETGKQTLAADVDEVGDILGRLPENIIFTEEKQGIWDGKAAGHLPIVEAKASGDSVTLNVKTDHGMSAAHYIVRHTIVNGNGELLGAETFKPTDEEAVSTHEIKIPAGDGKARQLFVMSYCNLHDLWLMQTKLEV